MPPCWHHLRAGFVKQLEDDFLFDSVWHIPRKLPGVEGQNAKESSDHCSTLTAGGQGNLAHRECQETHTNVSRLRHISKRFFFWFYGFDWDALRRLPTQQSTQNMPGISAARVMCHSICVALVFFIDAGHYKWEFISGLLGSIKRCTTLVAQYGLAFNSPRIAPQRWNNNGYGNTIRLSLYYRSNI